MGPGASPRWDPAERALALTGCVRSAVVDVERVRSSFPLKCTLEAAGLFIEIVLEGKAGVSVSYSATISACEKGQLWQLSLSPFGIGAAN